MAKDTIPPPDGAPKRKHRLAKKPGPTETSQGGGIGEFLRGLFSKHGPKEDAAPISRFELSLNEMIEKSNSIVKGRVHQLNLVDLVVRRGKDLEQMTEKAMKLAAHAIDEHLTEGEAFHRAGNVFYFLFPTLTAQAGELKCATIADQIARLFAANQSGLFKLEIDSAVNTMNRQTPKAATARKSGDNARREMNGGRRRLEEEKRKKSFEQAIVSRTLRTKAVPNESATDVFAVVAPSERRADLPPPEGIAVMYGTIWNVKNKLLTAYKCIPVTLEADGASYPLKLEQQAVYDRQTLMALDRYVQKQATTCLRKLLSAGQKTLVVLPINFKTVNDDASLTRYKKGLDDLSDEERRHIVLELVDPPRDLPGLRIASVVRTMRDSARTVMAQIPVDSTNLDSWSQAGVHAVGIDLRGVSKDEKALLTGMDELAARAEQSKLHTFAYGLDTISMATIAVTAGIDYIEGNAVRAPVESLEHVKPFETENLLAHLIPG